MEEQKSFIGQKVKIILTNNLVYSGQVLEENADILLLLDKFGDRVFLSKKIIGVISLKKGDDAQ